MDSISRNLATDADLDECQATWSWLPPEPRPKPSRRREARHMSTEEIARELGVSRQRVAQLERSALRKLRYWLAQRGLSLDDL